MLDLLKKPVAEPANLPLAKIRIDGGTQMRIGLNEETVAEYADAINAGAQLPPPVVFYDGNEYWLGDGFHRVEAYKWAYKEIKVIGSIDVDVRVGTRRDAVLFAAGANASHGLRRTAADKERGVDTLLRDEEWAGWSDREIAKRCNVSPTFVGNRRKLLYPEGSDGERTYQTKHGTVATMNTAKIGKIDFTLKELDLTGCIALVWRAIKHNCPMNQPVERLRWLQKARMQAFWDQLAYDDAQPGDDLILLAVSTVDFELSGRIDYDRRVAERAAEFAPKYMESVDTKADKISRLEGWLLRKGWGFFSGPEKPSGVSKGKNIFQWSKGDLDGQLLAMRYAEKMEKEGTANPVTVHVDSENDDDTPLVGCPHRGQSQADYDGFGLLHCDHCGYCTHISVTGGVCGICGEVVGGTHGEPLIETAGADPRCGQLQRLLNLYQQALDSGDEYGQITGCCSHTPPMRRALEPMIAELQSTLRALCAVEV